MRPCMPYAVLLRGGTGLRNEKTFSPFAEAFGDSAKLFCGRLRPPGAARAFSNPKRDGDIANPARRAGAERCVRRARRCGKIATKELSARDGRRFFAAGRSAAFALALGGFVYWPESTSASRQPSRLPMRKAGKKRLSARAGAAAGQLRAVDRGLRNSTAGGGHGMRRVMKKYGLSSRTVRFFPIVRRAVSPGLHNITNEMKNRTILRLPFDRLGGGLRV